MTPSSNLAAYGPSASPINGFSTSIAADGALNLSGKDGLKGGRGISWKLDAKRFTPGDYTLSLTKQAGSRYYVGLFASSDGNLHGGNRLGYITTGAKSVRVTVTAQHIAAGLRLGILLYQDGPTDPFGPDTLHVMLQPAEQSTAWERPDDTSAGGDGN